MRYAITFTIDDTWNTTNTFILETDVSPVDMTDEQITKMFESYGVDSDDAESMAYYSGRWYCNNLDNTDVFMRGDM